MPLAIGCDVGGTNTRSALIDTDTGKIVARRKTPSPVGDYFVAYAVLLNDLRELQALAHKPVPVGVAVAAQLDPARRTVLAAPNLKWWDAPLSDDLSRALGVPVQLDNDVRAAARGELRFGALEGATTGACVFWGSGIGGAVVCGGQVVIGATALAGEVGHTIYVPGGLKCGCGKLGCVEAYAGGHLLVERMRKARIPGESAQDLLKQARRGQRAAKALVADAVNATAILMAQLVTILDPDRIVLGGGLGTVMFTAVRTAMKPYILKVRRGRIPLVRPNLGDDAGLLGAASLFDKSGAVL